MSNREINQSQNNKRGVCCHVVLFTLRDSFIPVIIDRKEFAVIYLSLYSFCPDYHLIMLMIVFLTVRIQMQTCQIFSDWKNICVSYQWYKHHISHKYFKNRYSQPCSWKWIINVIKERQEENQTIKKIEKKKNNNQEKTWEKTENERKRQATKIMRIGDKIKKKNRYNQLADS